MREEDEPRAGKGTTLGSTDGEGLVRAATEHAGALVAERHGWAEGEEVARPRYMASSPRDPR